MKKQDYHAAFMKAIQQLEDIVQLEKRIPTNTDCIDITLAISDQLNVNLSLHNDRLVLDNEIETELFINRRVFGPNDLKIELYLFYDGVKNAQFEFNFYPDGTYFKHSTMVNAIRILESDIKETPTQN